MPSVITHDTFGREIYAQSSELIGQSQVEKNAFLLGCQGPDPMFYAAINPLVSSANSFAKKMHRNSCTEFLCALALGVSRFKESLTKDIARAFSLGYLMHFELDSKVHPFVFYQQFAYCDAGVSGLDRSNQREVHVAIECELDELVLTLKRGQTISTFDPSHETLRCSKHSLEIIDHLIEFAILTTFQQKPPNGAYRLSVKAYRQVLSWLYSATGVKRELLGRFERIFRKYSYLEAMIHKNEKITDSIFDNHNHNVWQDPWIEDKTHNESFWDLYESALNEGCKHVETFSSIIDEIGESLNAFKGSSTSEDLVRALYSKAEEMTKNLNFYGCPETLADPKTGRTPKQAVRDKK